MLNHKIYFNGNDQEVIIAAVIAFLGVIYGVAIGAVVHSRIEKNQKVVFALFENAKKAFLMCRDERLQIAIYLYLFSLAAPILGTFLLINYSEKWVGIIYIGVVAFALYISWAIITRV